MNTLLLAAAANAAFNLICVGEASVGRMDFSKPAVTPAQVELHVDLNEKRWCAGKCETTSPIFSVTSTQIVFSAEQNEFFDHVHVVNRESGEYLDRTRYLATSGVRMTMGKCERAAFTGFPAQKF